MRQKPECYSPGRTKSYAEIAENDCFTCPERATCLEFVKDVDISRNHSHYPHLQYPPPLPSTDQIIALAVATGLARKNNYELVESNWGEGREIRDQLIDFATKLLQTYGNLP